METCMDDSWVLCRVRGDLAPAIPASWPIRIVQPFDQVRKYIRRHRAFRLVSVERWPGYAFVTGPRSHVNALKNLSLFIGFVRGDDNQVLEVSSSHLEDLCRLDPASAVQELKTGARVHFNHHQLMESMEGVVLGFDLGSAETTAIVEVRNEYGQTRVVRTEAHNLRQSA